MAGNVTTQAPGPDALLNVALRLDYLVGQITPEEFRWQDANFDRDSALGRELLFLIANNEWARASAETIDITRSDTVETTIKIDVDLSRITHEAFRGRTGQLWLPVLVLPPLRQRLPEPDPFATLTVADADGSLLATLPNADVRHRAAAALAEIIVNIAVARLPDVGGRNVSASRDQRLLLSAALYRLLRSEHVPSAVMAREVPPRRAAAGPVQRIGKARRELAILLDSYASLLTAPDKSGGPGGPDGAHVPGAAGAPDAAPDDNDPAGRSSFARRLTERAIQVLRAVAESAVVVVAADLGRTPTVLTVTVPSRALHQAPRRRTRVAPAPASRASRWLRPVMWNWILPRARLQIDLLLPSADADRQVQVNLPDGVSFDPSRPIATRAELDITSRQPLPVQQLPELMRQLMDATQDWPPALYQGLADLAGAKTDAAREALRDHRVGAAPGQRRLTAAEATRATREFRERLDALSEALADISAGGPGDGRRRRLAAIWAPGGDWLQVPMRRRTSTDTVSPDVVVARARMIEDVSQRAAPTAARIGVHIAVTDSEYFSIARFAGWMSVLLMAVVLGFFGIGQLLGTSSQQVSPGPAADQAQAGRLVLASDLDVVTGSGLHRTESATAATWRVMAICADWRSGVESEILAALDPGLDLAGLTTAVLHGKSVVLLLGHRPGGRGGHDQPALAGPGRGGDLVVYLDAWQSRKDLGEAREHPLLRVHMRTPDRAGATLEVLESLRATLQEMAPGVLGAGQWKVWYTRTVVAGGNAALIQLTVRLAVNPATTPSPDKPIAGWGPAEFSRIERRALALAASKMAASAALAPADAGLDAPEDTVISVGLMTTPDLQPDSAPAGASASC